MTEPAPSQTPQRRLERSAVADLSQRLALDPADVRVVSFRNVTWSDGALGCPAPDGIYTQALVDGFHLILTDGSARYHYHARADGEPFLCPNERRRDPIDSELNRS